MIIIDLITIIIGLRVMRIEDLDRHLLHQGIVGHVRALDHLSDDMDMIVLVLVLTLALAHAHVITLALDLQSDDVLAIVRDLGLGLTHDLTPDPDRRPNGLDDIDVIGHTLPHGHRKIGGRCAHRDLRTDILLRLMNIGTAVTPKTSGSLPMHLNQARTHLRQPAAPLLARAQDSHGLHGRGREGGRECRRRERKKISRGG